MKFINVILTSFSFSAVASLQPIEPILVPIYQVNDPTQVDFQFGKYEVTVAEFLRFSKATNYQTPDKCMLFTEELWPSFETPQAWDHPAVLEEPYRPMVCVGVKAAKAYAKWLSEKTGKAYSLPTQVQWRYVASGGESSRYYFGEDENNNDICKYENLEDYANIVGLLRDHDERYEQSLNCNDGAVYHTVVGMYRANGFGVHDILGNVAEILDECAVYDAKDDQVCTQYAVGGEGWHWQPRKLNSQRLVGADFYGSIEGFRLVLNSSDLNLKPSDNKQFLAGLKQSQAKALIKHTAMKKMPRIPQGLTVHKQQKNQYRISWQSSEQQNVKFELYRSYLDLSQQHNRKFEKITEDLRQAFYIDNVPGSGLVSYKVIAKNNVGETPFSKIVTVGMKPHFKLGQEIQAEHYYKQSNVDIIDGKTMQGVGFFANLKHYPSGTKPFIPNWLSLPIKVEKETQVNFSYRVRGAKGAKFELWQGNYLVGQFSAQTGKTPEEKSISVKLIKAQDPIEIRSIGKSSFLLDWVSFL